ncbi:MAG: SDR family oxidoreductase [Ignavibacteriales bacterium]|nr:SDR family oxidoreductase [Ignavibacteriales bacterium]
MKLQNKCAIVTGGSKGLGKALAQKFISEGARVAICSRHKNDLETVRKQISSDGVLAVTCDISNSQESQKFVEKVLDEFGHVDILVNNASRLGPRVSITEYPLNEWDETVQTNLNGPFFVTRLVLPSMIERKSGSIINISASVGKAGRAKWGAYAVSKFGIEGFTQVLAEELKPHNISVNCVNPGAMATAMRREAYPEEDQSILRTPEQVTDIFVYLASDNGIGISGQSFDASTFISKPKMV